MKAILLSAGFGSRFYPYTKHDSKLSIPFLNIPIIGYPLKILEDIGVTDLVVNTHHQANQVKDTIQSLEIDISCKNFIYEPYILGGAGSVKANESYLDGDDFIYLNGDSVFLSGNFFSDLKRFHQSKNALVTLLVKKSLHLKEIDLWANHQNQIQSVFEKDFSADSAYKSYFFTGFALLNRECLSLLDSSSKNIFDSLVLKNLDRCFVFEKEDLKFFEVGSLCSYLQSSKDCLDILFSKKNSTCAVALQSILKRFLGDFKFHGMNYLSHTEVPVALQEQLSLTGSYFLGGKKVAGLETLKVKDFCVIGSNVSIQNSVAEASVISSDLSLNRQTLTHSLFCV